MLKQTLDAGYDPGDLLIDGSNVQFSSSDEFLSILGPGEAARSVSISLAFDNSDAMALTFSRGPAPRRSFGVEEMQLVEAAGTMTVRVGQSSEELASMLGERAVNHARRFADPAKGTSVRFKVTKEKCLFNVEGTTPEYGIQMLRTLQHQRILSRTIHIPGLRGNPERTYQKAGSGPEFPGTFQRYTASILASWLETAPEKIKAVGNDLRELELTWKIEVKPANDTRLQLAVGRLPAAAHGGAKDLVSIADVGLGVSQVLPILVALQAAEPNRLVYIEQPEIHLHPRAQVALAAVFKRALDRGVRIVVETHSALFLLALQALTAKGEIPADKIALNWFSRDRRTGATTVSPGLLDEKGRFGNWPVDFGDVSLELESQYLELLGL
ncbi:MAG TPA: AAA family ATPase [Candidatus Thermoplasmatota archaeon]|nr:AAA family ATPase [Candidatus Thermoplasmatota archaeon]